MKFDVKAGLKSSESLFVIGETGPSSARALLEKTKTALQAVV
ncbi:MAG TPA: hypothetical protein VJ021_02430 [Thermoplasmata archaeon]|nr:hypothetical protein [Thermoplasmata archaeon]